MSLAVNENAVTAPVPKFKEGWFCEISNKSKVTYIQNLRNKSIC